MLKKLIQETKKPFQSFWQLLLANLILAFLVAFVFWSGSASSPREMIIAFIWSFAVCITQWVGNVMVGVALDQRFNWIEQPRMRFVSGVFALALYSAMAYAVVQLTFMYWFSDQYPDDWISWILKNAKFPILLSLAISTIFSSIGFFKAWRESERKAVRFETQMLTYKYESLRNQINPHFLFNSFNVLTDLVYEDQDLAAKFIQQLSELYRYVLDSREKDLVPLTEELDFIKSYLFLLDIRFENKLQVEMDLENDSKQVIVPMSLQLLIENAVKHNEASKAHPLRVHLEQKGDWIVVENSLRLKKVGERSSKTGLKNIQDQYARWSEQDVVVEQTEDLFRVKLPVLQEAGK